MGDTGLNPVEAEIFFQASFLKFLKLPPPCEGPLFTWMLFVWQPRFIYLKKKIPYASLCRGKWGAREQSAMASGIAEPGCFVPESSALIVKLPPVSHTISFNLSISLSFLRTRNATPSFHVPSVISQSLEALRSNMENKNQPCRSILVLCAQHLPTITHLLKFVISWLPSGSFFLTIDYLNFVLYS